jgi:hypothetical protein
MRACKMDACLFKGERMSLESLRDDNRKLFLRPYENIKGLNITFTPL